METSNKMSIDQVLGFVLELEEQSKEVVRLASERRSSLTGRVDEKLAKIRAKHMDNAQKRIEIIRSEESEQLQKNLEQVHQANEIEMQRLTDAADRELENWAELIFRNVVYMGQE